jgi:hypothetical protein
MSLPFLNTGPGYDEELHNSVGFEHGLHATSIWRSPGRRRPRPEHGLGAAARGLQAVPVQPFHPRGRGRRLAAARDHPHGRGLEARVGVNRAGPGNPLSDEELARKFHDNAVRSLPEERAAELAARTLALPDAQSVEDLTALLTSAGER